MQQFSLAMALLAANSSSGEASKKASGTVSPNSFLADFALTSPPWYMPSRGGSPPTSAVNFETCNYEM